MSTEKNIGAHFHARLRAQKFYAIAFAFSTTSSMVPESKNADSGISSCFPSRISLKPRIVSESGTATAKFTVKASEIPNESPKTGDDNMVAVWSLAAILSLAVLGFTTVGSKKKRAK